jgi:hypothetical protein
VKDTRGDMVFYEDFGTIPDEWKSHMRETVIAKARALAHFLVALSEQYGSPFYDGY